MIMLTFVGNWAVRAMTLALALAGAIGLAGCDQPSANTDGKAKAATKAAAPAMVVTISQPHVADVVVRDVRPRLNESISVPRYLRRKKQGHCEHDGPPGP